MHVLKPYRFIWVYELKGHETPFINNNHETKKRFMIYLKTVQIKKGRSGDFKWHMRDTI